MHLLLPVTVLGLLTTGLPAADYAQWRGPHRDGHSPDTGLLQEWPKDGPALLWQVTDVGAGYSTPSVAGDRIYLISTDGSEESVLALAVKDGSRVWDAKLGKVGHPEQNPSYPGSRSTPTVDSGMVFALGSAGDLVCFETAKGKEVWRKQLRTDFEGQYGEWAYAESPLVDGDQLICTPGGTNATVVALNKRTGDLIWKCSVPKGTAAGYSSAVVTDISGVKQYVQFLASGVMGLDAGTGRLLWRFKKTGLKSPAVIMTPLVSDGMVYSGAFRATAALIKPVLKNGDFTVDELYSGGKLPITQGGVVKVGDYFYGGGGGGQSMLCVDFKTGEIQWEERAFGPCSLLVADNRIYVHGDSGEVGLVELDANRYREKGRFTPPNPPDRGQAKAWAYPVVANGRLYIRDQNSLWCYDVRAAK